MRVSFRRMTRSLQYRLPDSTSVRQVRPVDPVVCAVDRPDSGTPYENAAGQQPCPCMIVP